MPKQIKMNKHYMCMIDYINEFKCWKLINDKNRIKPIPIPSQFQYAK